MPPSAPAEMPGATGTGTCATSARETFSPAVCERERGVNEARRTDGARLTFVGQVHGEGGADVDAGDEPLDLELGNVVELPEDDVGGEIFDAGTVHDEEGVTFALLELPLSFEGCGRETGDAAGPCDGIRWGYMIWKEAIRTYLVPDSGRPVLRP